jgi:hypothetical protein
MMVVGEESEPNSPGGDVDGGKNSQTGYFAGDE